MTETIESLLDAIQEAAEAGDADKALMFAQAILTLTQCPIHDDEES